MVDQNARVAGMGEDEEPTPVDKAVRASGINPQSLGVMDLPRSEVGEDGPTRGERIHRTELVRCDFCAKQYANLEDQPRTAAGDDESGSRLSHVESFRKKC